MCVIFDLNHINPIFILCYGVMSFNQLIIFKFFFVLLRSQKQISHIFIISLIKDLSQKIICK
jgi:hypothetical protein